MGNSAPHNAVGTCNFAFIKQVFKPYADSCRQFPQFFARFQISGYVLFVVAEVDLLIVSRIIKNGGRKHVEVVFTQIVRIRDVVFGTGSQPYYFERKFQIYFSVGVVQVQVVGTDTIQRSGKILCGLRPGHFVVV